jgi:hypothetical protein
LAFFLLNIFVITIILAIQLNSEDGITSINEVFNSGVGLTYILMAIGCFLVANMISSLKLDIYHKKLQIGRVWRNYGNLFEKLKCII